MKPCECCENYFEKYSCGMLQCGECDCPKCQGYCACSDYVKELDGDYLAKYAEDYAKNMCKEYGWTEADIPEQKNGIIKQLLDMALIVMTDEQKQRAFPHVYHIYSKETK